MRESSLPSPERIFSIVNGFQAGRAIEAAVRLDLFSALSQDQLTARELADRVGASERGTRILCDYLTVQELLQKEGDRYRQTETSSLYLDRSSKAFMGTIVEFLLSPSMVKAFEDLDQAVTRGGTVMGEEGTMEPEHPIWVNFARSMGKLVTPAAHYISELLEFPERQTLRVLDIAAGHGLFGITIAQRYSHAEVFAVDWPGVLSVAEENAEAAGVERRFHKIEGSAFEVEFGQDHDVVLATNFFHHFDLETCRELVDRMVAAMKPTATLVTLEFVPNEDRISPVHAACFPLIMLATTARGDAYTFQEYEKLFQSAGLSSNELHQVPRSPHQVIISKRVRSTGQSEHPQ